MTPLDPDRTLALAYVPAARRAAVSALWHLDAALGAVVAGGREPMLRQIKLVWWRDALERLDVAPPPGEPVLQSLSAHVLSSGVSGAELSAFQDAWATLLNEEALSSSELDRFALGRGGRLFDLTARLLGVVLSSEQKLQGESWALMDLARHSGEPDASAAQAAARDRSTRLIWPKNTRSLGMLSALAARDSRAALEDLEPQGSPSRMWRMLRLRLTGR